MPARPKPVEKLKFDDLLQHYTEQYKGVHKPIIAALVPVVLGDSDLTREVVNRFVKMAVSQVVYQRAGKARADGIKAASKGAGIGKPKFGESRRDIVERSRRADVEWRSSLYYYQLEGGLYLGEATRDDVIASIQKRKQRLADFALGVKGRIKFEETIVSLLRARKTNAVIAVLTKDNESSLMKAMKKIEA
jgi:hypothetical protein